MNLYKTEFECYNQDSAISSNFTMSFFATKRKHILRNFFIYSFIYGLLLIKLNKKKRYLKSIQKKLPNDYFIYSKDIESGPANMARLTILCLYWIVTERRFDKPRKLRGWQSKMSKQNTAQMPHELYGWHGEKKCDHDYCVGVRKIR